MMDSNRKVLIVDNDEDIGNLIKKRLEIQWIDAAIVKTGGEALNWLAANDTALILLDLNLPDITGKELLSLLEKRERSIPFIVVSGISDVRLTVEMMKLGALDVLLKDSVLPELIGPIVMHGLETLDVRRKYGESQTRIRYITETIDDVFWMMNETGKRVIFVSPDFESIWGISAKELYEHSYGWHEAIIEEDRSKIIRSFEKLRKGAEREFDEVYRIRDKFGRIRWIRDRGYANYGKGKTILNFTGVATEITEQKELERQILEIAEEERMRIGQDLHDDLCQRLAAIGLKCGMIHGVLENENHIQAESMKSVIRELREASSLTRSIAKGLAPVSLEAEGLMAELMYFTEITAERFQLTCQFDCPELIEVSNATIASNIFRIAQELVNNAAKHARPSRILVGLYYEIGGLRLEVTNDGKPFYHPKRRRDGMGLHLIQFRADAIGAALEYFPGDSPDGGTRVACIVPLRKRKEEVEQSAAR